MHAPSTTATLPSADLSHPRMPNPNHPVSLPSSTTLQPGRERDAPASSGAQAQPGTASSTSSSAAQRSEWSGYDLHLGLQLCLAKLSAVVLAGKSGGRVVFSHHIVFHERLWQYK